MSEGEAVRSLLFEDKAVEMGLEGMRRRSLGGWDVEEGDSLRVGVTVDEDKAIVISSLFEC